MSGKCKDCLHIEVCKLLDEHFDLNKRIREMKRVLNTNFDIEIKCSKFYSNQEKQGCTFPSISKLTSQEKFKYRPFKITY